MEDRGPASGPEVTSGARPPPRGSPHAYPPAVPRPRHPCDRISQRSNPDSLSRRGFLRAAALTGGGLAAASIAACAGRRPGLDVQPGPLGRPERRGREPDAAAASPAMSHGPTHSEAPATPAASGSTDLPPGWSEHDIASRTVIRRYLGNLVPALGDIYPTAVAEARRHPRRRGRLPGAAAEAIVRAGAEPL